MPFNSLSFRTRPTSRDILRRSSPLPFSRFPGSDVSTFPLSSFPNILDKVAMFVQAIAGSRLLFVNTNYHEDRTVFGPFGTCRFNDAHAAIKRSFSQ